MKIEQELDQIDSPEESILTVGVFDGVHLGHQHLISELEGEASAVGAGSGVVTFKNHPLSVLRADFKPQYVTTMQQRVQLIENLGVDLVAPVTFDHDLSQLGAREFVRLLQERLGMRGLVIGPDFAMGHNREGDAEMLSNLGEESGFSVRVVQPLLDPNGEAVRSTSIRRALADGDVEGVEGLLGRRFTIDGIVVEGEGRGGPLGFPTANLQILDELAVPANGIYATWARVGDERYMAATSIGVRPTFDDSGYAIEAYLLDFEGDLYGSTLSLEFVRRLREEQKFDSVDALKKGVNRDVERTKQALTIAK